ncbi:hypothetical protein GCM10022399_23640 [Terrabacter ginsenosidimutans]|uniref:Uncharacterized protein n=1 Tax=Terrabacter ginsenosidimutans TaxID=490575 RepID=A0ABP7DLQ1_9MICO
MPTGQVDPVPDHHHHSRCALRCRELRDEAGLADAGLAGHDRCTTDSFASARGQEPELVELCVPADHRARAHVPDCREGPGTAEGYGRVTREQPQR